MASGEDVSLDLLEEIQVREACCRVHVGFLLTSRGQNRFLGLMLPEDSPAEDEEEEEVEDEKEDDTALSPRAMLSSSVLQLTSPQLSVRIDTDGSAADGEPSSPTGHPSPEPIYRRKRLNSVVGEDWLAKPLPPPSPADVVRAVCGDLALGLSPSLMY